MSSISSNLEAKFIFLNLHPETNGGKVELLGTEQSWALNDLVPVLLSHPIPVPSLAASYSFSFKEVAGGKPDFSPIATGCSKQ